jgi:alcohol dehydrogenase
MKNTKAARIHEYGGPEVVQVEDLSLADPQPGEILIRVQAAGVNPIDWKIRSGYMQKVIPLTLPFTLGVDFSGVVESAGDGVADLKVGDEVYGQAGVVNKGSGSFEEYCVAKAKTVAAKPRGLSDVETGALPLVGVSAVQALTEGLSLSKGQSILIHGGAGGIGSLAIQLARHLGAHVATTASSNDIDYVKELGAEQVIDYKNQKFEDVLSDLDAVYDTVGGDTYRRSFKVLKRGGRLVSMVERPDQGLIEEFGVGATFQSTQVNTERLTKLAEFVELGALKVHVDATFPLDETAEALRYLEKESPRGKVVIKVV